jgi:hypothetical protein
MTCLFHDAIAMRTTPPNIPDVSGVSDGLGSCQPAELSRAPSGREIMENEFHKISEVFAVLEVS